MQHATETDALNNQVETQYDVRGRMRAFTKNGPDGTITTRYDYNALSELVKVVDNKGNVFSAVFDNLGRRVAVQHPDAGNTSHTYDLAGNLLSKTTAQIRKEFPNSGAIQYEYEYERLTDIDYPRSYQNKVKYTYGKAGTGNKAGRLILQQDASGGQEFFYGLQGEVTKVIRTVLISPVFATTYISEQQYDTWNRIKKMTYPDGEVVTYHYNKGGNLSSMSGVKLGSTYKYVDQVGYDEFEDRTYLRYGNGAENLYTYDVKRNRLQRLQANTVAGKAMMNNTYTYDAVSNVVGVVNDVQAQKGKLGGYAKQQYQYDNLYRLNTAGGEYSGSEEAASYNATFSYDNLNNIVRKTITTSAEAGNYDLSYTYDGTAPHQATQTGEDKHRYDANGNLLGYGNIENYWDEENRLTAVVKKGVVGQYTYDAAGIRVLRSSGGLQGVWLNGAPAGLVRHNENYTVYVSPFIACKRASYVKHYYIENERIVTKQGYGSFTNISFPQSGLTAGNIDYTRRAALMEKSLQEHYASLGVSPGPPTDKFFYARPENSGIAVPVFTDSTATNVPVGWPGNTTPPVNGPPVFVGTMPSNDSVKAGYGFTDAGHLYENSQYFYHPDYWGSTSFITNSLGEASLHVEYIALGETFSEEHTGSYITPYLFNAKGRDEETGYYYYGDRYYDPQLSQWLSVGDPLGENYPHETAGVYAGIDGMMRDDEDSDGKNRNGNVSRSNVVSEASASQDAPEIQKSKVRKPQNKPGIRPTGPKTAAAMRRAQNIHNAQRRQARLVGNVTKKEKTNTLRKIPVTRPRR
jgi:RHS repeat-associated protein